MFNEEKEKINNFVPLLKEEQEQSLIDSTLRQAENMRVILKKHGFTGPQAHPMQTRKIRQIFEESAKKNAQFEDESFKKDDILSMKNSIKIMPTQQSTDGKKQTSQKTTIKPILANHQCKNSEALMKTNNIDEKIRNPTLKLIQNKEQGKNNQALPNGKLKRIIALRKENKNQIEYLIEDHKGNINIVKGVDLLNTFPDDFLYFCESHIMNNLKIKL